MSETKFTPGPWRKDEETSLRNDLIDENYHCIEGGCIYGEDRKGFQITGCMSNSDAHLIAAAPELYEWLERCLAIVDHGAGPPNWDGIRAALAKARGEAV